MREIKFRAWDNHDQCWLNSFAIFYNGEFADMAKGVMRGSICQCDINYQKTPSHIIIEQFTGLYDKNGVDIYEGDIVRYTESYGCNNQEDELCESVVTINPTYIFPFSNVRDVEDCWYSVEHSEYEVIGNIHDQAKKDIKVTIATKLTKTQSLGLDKISSAVRNYINGMEALETEHEALKRDIARFMEMNEFSRLFTDAEREEYQKLWKKLAKLGKGE